MGTAGMTVPCVQGGSAWPLLKQQEGTDLGDEESGDQRLASAGQAASGKLWADLNNWHGEAEAEVILGL